MLCTCTLWAFNLHVFVKLTLYYMRLSTVTLKSYSVHVRNMFRVKTETNLALLAAEKLPYSR